VKEKKKFGKAEHHEKVLSEVPETLGVTLYESSSQKFSEKNELSGRDSNDTILRWNSHRQNSLDLRTDAFELWKSKGASFKKFKKVDHKMPKPAKKPLGYHVQEHVPSWYNRVKTMRETRSIIE